ncbi:hypothetical protein F4859DRAFT_493404 [Xylaria cf. heliscus]|nr:hypothetical protein F4859DRAFT_493404 [Xylaria cf. heliscus]
MRLLRTDTLALVEFFDENVPAYAILSHTWGSDELSLQDLQRWQVSNSNPGEGQVSTAADGDIAVKAGFIKVKKAAAFAAERGFTYLWVDTCCIDKTSSAELSEAINSMYKWYVRSAECHALLADVPPAAEQDPESPGSAFYGSRWFTRGWTLQELIAPRTLLFLARDWSILGDKRNNPALVDVVADITGVPVAVLLGKARPGNISVASRLQWASGRQTTRVEDIAYCLLGIFDVNMPLLYGEGQRAFIRLQEAILKSTSDQSIFAWNDLDNLPQDPDSVYGLFAQSPANFKHCAGIETLPIASTAVSIPVEMTSHGVRVQLYLRPQWQENLMYGDEDYYAILDCAVRIGDMDYCPAIWLRRLGQDQFGRLYPWARKLLPPTNYGMPTYIEGYRPIFVREAPTYYGIPSFRVSPANIFPLEEAFPLERWNPLTLTLKSEYSRRTELTGLFRLRDDLGGRFDVAVGLSKTRGFAWEPWCAQRRAHDDVSLAAAYEALQAEIRVKMATRDKFLLTQEPQQQFFWYSLQSLIGEDSQLFSEARVSDVMLQGRRYVWLSVIAKIEICTFRELDSIPKEVQELAFSTNARYTKFLTSSYTRHSLDAHQKIGRQPYGVRCRPNPPPTDARDGKDLLVFLGLSQPKLPADAADATSRNPKDVQDEQAHLLQIAAFEGDIAVLKKYLLPRVVLTHRAKEGWTVLHIAAALGHAAVIQFILSQPAVDIESLVNCRTTGLLETPLHVLAGYAPADKQLECFQALWVKSAGLAERNALEETPLHRAAAANCPELIRAIVVATDGRNTLFNRNSDVMRLIDIDTYQPEFARQVDYSDRWGRSPLWHAAATGATAAVTALLELGAQVNLMDDEGLTPLHAAARGGHDAAFQTLLNRGANPRFDTQLFGLTPLHLAVLFGHRECVFLLLSLFGRNIVNAGIQTKAIHLAAAGGHLDMVQDLQKAGAVVDIACDECLRLADEGGRNWAELVPGASNVEAIAERYGHQDIVAFLQSVKGRITANEALPPITESELRHDSRSNYSVQPLNISSTGSPQVPHNTSFSGPYQTTQPILEATHLGPPFAQPTQPYEPTQYFPPPFLAQSPVGGSETAYYYSYPSQPYQPWAQHPLYQPPQTYPPTQYQSNPLYQAFPTSSQLDPSQQSQLHGPSIVNPTYQSYPPYQTYQPHEVRQSYSDAARRIDSTGAFDAETAEQAQYLERFEAEMRAGAVLFGAEDSPILELDSRPLPIQPPIVRDSLAAVEPASLMRKKWERTRHRRWARNPLREWSIWGYDAADFWKRTEPRDDDDATAVEPSNSTTSPSSSPGTTWSQLMTKFRK